MLRNLTLFLALTLVTSSLLAQNVEVQSFNYHSETRDTVVNFPITDNNQYEKILMYYSMRCKDGLVSPPVQGQTNIGCGEWDYSCSTYLTDSTKVDSLRSISPSHVISNFSDDVFNYTAQTTYNYYQSSQYEVIYNDIISESEYNIVDGDLEYDALLGNDRPTRSQLLYPASMLTSTGMQAGEITGLKLDLSNMAAGYKKLRIKMKHTAKTVLDATDIDRDDFEEVYFLDSDLNTGIHSFPFYAPFDWDGSSNILLDISYAQNTTTTTAVKAATQADISTLSSVALNDHYLEINGSGLAIIDTPFPTVTDEITIVAWQYGSDDLPISSTLFEGKDANNLRQVNAHVPWGNSRVYWDCGNDGGGYDRIDKAANPEDFKNQWNHWVFTKNATTGSMKIYLNGTLWHSGTDKFKSIDLQAFSIGGANTGVRSSFGNIDEFQIWNKELSLVEIQEWMNKSITTDHPSYSNLVAYYPLNDVGSNIVTDASPNNYDGSFQGLPIYRAWEGSQLLRNFTPSEDLPSLTFVQGEYDLSINEIILLDSLVNAPNQVDEYIVVGTDLMLNNTSFLFQAGAMPIFDEMGNQIGSVTVPSEGSIAIADLEHYTKTPSKLELMSFVTPYGINLDLGIGGKTWVFDVTDFGPILKGNKRITMERGGQWQEDMDIRFVFVEGTPSRDVLNLQQVWRVTSQSYTQLLNDSRFEARDVLMPAAASMYKLKAAITGHGQEGEFIPRTHFLNINGGNNELQWQVWKECAGNPVYPQGGTWVYDRAGWCPGMATDIQELDITEWATPGQSTNIDYGVQTAAGDSRYIVNVQLVSYGDPNFTQDAALVDLINPSNKIEHDRFNPMCGKPKIVIQNNGMTPLTTLQISYDVDGLTPATYTWNGNLAYLESEEVELPTLDLSAMTTENGTFNVSISAPNNGSDEYNANNTLSTSFRVVPTMSDAVVIKMRTNNAAGETSYKVLDVDGNVIFSKAGGLSPNTTYTDSLFNLDGCYRLLVEDSGEDGIAWWANNDGNGYIQLQDKSGLTTTFEPDFGRFFIYEFRAIGVTSEEEANQIKHVEVYPNPSADFFNVDIKGYKGDLRLRVLSQMGQEIYTIPISATNQINHQIDLSTVANGVYYLELITEQGTETMKLVKMTK